jgi:dipeptidyl-peptidase-3
LVTAKIRPRNTRISKDFDANAANTVFNIFQASVEKSDNPKLLGHLENGAAVTTTKGDHSAELERIGFHLDGARKATQSRLRVKFLDYYERFFQTGDAVLFDNSQRVWMKNKQPRVETFFGFNHKYRDPAGARVEFQGFVGMLDAKGSKELNALQRDAQTYITTLPWVRDLQGKGGKNGPFELDIFQAPDFNAVYGKRPGLLYFLSLSGCEGVMS